MYERMYVCMHVCVYVCMYVCVSRGRATGTNAIGMGYGRMFTAPLHVGSFDVCNKLYVV